MIQRVKDAGSLVHAVIREEFAPRDAAVEISSETVQSLIANVLDMLQELDSKAHGLQNQCRVLQSTHADARVDMATSHIVCY